jgi:hypothetical protein
MKNTKEVYFDEYCKTCKYESLKDYEDPCNDCLDYPWNSDSHKPVEWKEKDNA